MSAFEECCSPACVPGNLDLLVLQTAAYHISRLQEEKDAQYDRMAATHQELCDVAGKALADKARSSR